MSEAIALTTDQLPQRLGTLKAGDRVLLTGTIYTARDAAHKRIFQLLDEGKPLPFPLKGAVIYYAGPTPGQQGMAVGACGPMARELDLSVLRRSRVYVDSLLSMPQATGDLLIPIREGSYRMEDIAGELGGVLTGSCPGRAGGDRETITLFESCGLAMEDIGAALAALQAAEGTPFLF